jgi:hypothetical protein
MDNLVIRLVHLIMWIHIIRCDHERAAKARDLWHKLTIGHNTETRNR